MKEKQKQNNHSPPFIQHDILQIIAKFFSNCITHSALAVECYYCHSNNIKCTFSKNCFLICMEPILIIKPLLTVMRKSGRKRFLLRLIYPWSDGTASHSSQLKTASEYQCQPRGIRGSKAYSRGCYLSMGKIVIWEQTLILCCWTGISVKLSVFHLPCITKLYMYRLTWSWEVPSLWQCGCCLLQPQTRWVWRNGEEGAIPFSPTALPTYTEEDAVMQLGKERCFLKGGKV